MASRSNKIFAGLIVAASGLAALAAFLPQALPVSVENLPMSPAEIALVNAASILVLYGGLGYLGLVLTRRLGWPDVWEPGFSRRMRWGVPALLGIGLGIAFIVVDGLATYLHPLGSLPHPPFPTSVLASAVAAIGEEVLFRLFLVPGGVWLISRVIFDDRFEGPAFWTMATVSALAFSAGHLPSVAVLYGFEVMDLPAGLMAELLLLNGALSFVAAWQLRRVGLLGAIAVHWWADVVWHVAWGAMQGAS